APNSARTQANEQGEGAARLPPRGKHDARTARARGAMKKLVNVLAIALTAGVLALAADLFRRVGIVLYSEQYLAFLLALAMALIFLHVPVSGRQRTGAVPWYDLAAALASFLPASMSGSASPICRRWC